MHSRKVFPAFAIALATGLTPAVHASAQSSVAPLTVRAPPISDAEIKSEAIKVSDLDLSSEAGAETLIGRIRGAAKHVCSPRPTHKANFKDVSDYDKCMSEAMERAVADSGSKAAAEIIKRTGD
jgi:UrcA family protein